MTVLVPCFIKTTKISTVLTVHFFHFCCLQASTSKAHSPSYPLEGTVTQFHDIITRKCRTKATNPLVSSTSISKRVAGIIYKGNPAFAWEEKKKKGLNDQFLSPVLHQRAHPSQNTTHNLIYHLQGFILPGNARNSEDVCTCLDSRMLHRSGQCPKISSSIRA